MSIEPQTVPGKAGLAEIITDPFGAVAAFDYDGTLAPIVDDPSQATPLPDVLSPLAELTDMFARAVIITGRPAQQVVDLAGFAGEDSIEGLVVLGHYGFERWDSASGNVESITPPDGLDQARSRLPDLLHDHEAATAYVEDKGLSVAVHTRRTGDPEATFDRLVEPLRSLADEVGLHLEPGRLVLELRPVGMDKGQALRGVLQAVDARSVLFAGDDLGDLPAYAEVERFRGEGGAGLLVCSGSAEVSELAKRADLVVDGPRGVAAFLSGLVSQLREP